MLITSTWWPEHGEPPFSEENYNCILEDQSVVWSMLWESVIRPGMRFTIRRRNRPLAVNMDSTHDRPAAPVVRSCNCPTHPVEGPTHDKTAMLSISGHPNRSVYPRTQLISTSKRCVRYTNAFGKVYWFDIASCLTWEVSLCLLEDIPSSPV